MRFWWRRKSFLKWDLDAVNFRVGLGQNYMTVAIANMVAQPPSDLDASSGENPVE
jgi:hypothetical protein